jgi:iron complex outermembrane receptor protein
MKKLYSSLALSLAILLSLFHLQSFAQNATGDISGTIKTSDGNPAQDVSVFIKDTNKGTISSKSGNYTIKGLKEGTYTLKITYTGVQPQEKTIEIVAGKTTQSDFSLVESANRLAEIQIVSNRTVNQKSVSLGKGGIAAKDLPQSVQVIDSTIINDQQANRLADVLKNVNGVAFAESRGSTGDTFLARGYSLGGNNVLKNGARSSIGGSPETSTLESVEVLKGSAALLYGGVTGGAVINMVTKKPKFNFGGEVSMRTGSYDFYKPTVDIYGPISKKIAFRAIATKDNAGSFRNNVSSDRLYINPSLLFKLGQKTELIAQGDYLKSDYTPDFGIGTVDGKIVNIGRDKFLNTPWAYNKTNSVTAQLNLNHEFNENWKINVIGSLQSYNRNYFGAERPAGNASGVVARNLSRSKSQEFSYNQQVNLTGLVKTGSITHTILIGADADQSRTASNSFYYPNLTTDIAKPITAFNYGAVNLLDESTYYGSGIMPETAVLNRTIAPTYRMGGFVQDLVTLTEKFKVLAGIRWTFQKTPITHVTNVITGQPVVATVAAGAPTPTAKIDKAYSPKFGLVYQPIKTTSFYASYANNFTSNSGTDVNFAPMAPSLIDQYEVGVKNDFFNGKMSFNVTLYKIINSNLAQTALLDANGNTNSNTNIKEFTGKTASEGLEVDVTGKLAPGLNFIAGYSYNFYRYVKTAPGGITEGERVIGSTPHSANGTVFYTFGSGKVKGLKLGASAFYVGERFSGFQTVKPPSTARAAPITVSSFQTFDLSAGYAFRKLSLLAKLSNLTNELNYYVHENYSINPIPPRMFSATLAYKFDL